MAIQNPSFSLIFPFKARFSSGFPLPRLITVSMVENQTCGYTHWQGFAIDLGSLEMDSWVFPTIIYMVELKCIMGTLLFPL